MATQASSDAPRVLVVDDEAMLADLLSQALRHEGWETATAKDGLDALAKATSFQPDVVILDVQMPRMDGLETLERLRARDPELPVLFLTARDAVADRVQGLRAGADDYVTKPFDLTRWRPVSTPCCVVRGVPSRRFRPCCRSRI